MKNYETSSVEQNLCFLVKDLPSLLSTHEQPKLFIRIGTHLIKTRGISKFSLNYSSCCSHGFFFHRLFMSGGGGHCFGGEEVCA